MKPFSHPAINREVAVTGVLVSFAGTKAILLSGNFRRDGPGEAAGGLTIDEEGTAGRDQRLVGHREAIGIQPTLVH